MSALLDLVVPGSGSAVDVLLRIVQLANEMKEVQQSCKRLHGRLEVVFTELKMMEEKGQQLQSSALDKYVDVLAKSVKCLENYRAKKLVFRLIQYRQMMGKIYLINEDIDMFFRVFNLATTAAMMDWRQQYESDQRVQRELINAMVRNSKVILEELQTPHKQAEFLYAVRYELDKQPDEEMLHVIGSMETTVMRLLKTSVQKLPQWYLPADVIEYDKEAFACGSFASVHRGIWGHGTKVVVKRFQVVGMTVDERMKHKIEAEMNLWYQFKNPNVIHMFGASHILYQAALGVDYIHEMKVVHGDLKLNNILVGSDGSAKLSDFGLSTIRTCSTLSRPSGKLEDTAGALRWRAPERLMKSPSFASDVYSLAICIIEAVTDQVPSNRLDDEAISEMETFLNARKKLTMKPGTSW